MGRRGKWEKGRWREEEVVGRGRRICSRKFGFYLQPSPYRIKMSK